MKAVGFEQWIRHYRPYLEDLLALGLKHYRRLSSTTPESEKEFLGDYLFFLFEHSSQELSPYV